MATLTDTTYEVQTDHQFRFRCGHHKVELQGEPRLWNDQYPYGRPKLDGPKWMLDMSDMVCPVGEHELEVNADVILAEHNANLTVGGQSYSEMEDMLNERCVDSWVMTLTGTKVWSGE